jgi:hypothetical protein
MIAGANPDGIAYLVEIPVQRLATVPNAQRLFRYGDRNAVVSSANQGVSDISP